MTERGRSAVQRDEAAFRIGPSQVFWDGTALTIEIDEKTVPLPMRIRGRVRLHPSGFTPSALLLDGAGRHRWWPVAPCSRIEVELENPALKWSGSGYLDINDGDEALEDGFSYWNWSRAVLDGGKRAVLLYDVTDRSGRRSGLALDVDRHGQMADIAQPAAVRLPRTLWQMPRETRADSGGGARVRSTLEDTPFYTRSLISARLLGQDALAMHESLSLDRFSARWVQALLHYRMPRRP